jgi:hypothetical protein
MKKYLLLILLVLTGCATTQNYEKILSSWVGAPESALISNWGPPSSSYQISANSKVITYMRGRNVQVGGFATTTPITTTTTGNIYGGVNANYSSTATSYVQSVSPVTNIAMNCSTRFTVNNGVIANWAWEGNDCRANVPPVSATDPNQAEVQNKFEQLKIVLDSICIDPQYAVYYKKTSCIANEVNFAQITDMTNITAEQKIVLVQQRIKITSTERMQDEAQRMRGVVGQKIIDVANTYLRPENEKNNLNLYNGLINWGEYNKKRKEIYMEASSRFSR